MSALADDRRDTTPGLVGRGSWRRSLEDPSALPPIGTMFRIRPTTSKMAPIVVRIGMLATRPMISRIRPRDDHVAPSFGAWSGGQYPRRVSAQTVGMEECFQSRARDRLVDRQGAAGGLDVEVLDHPAVVGDDAGALAVLPRLRSCRGRPRPPARSARTPRWRPRPGRGGSGSCRRSPSRGPGGTRRGSRRCPSRRCRRRR